MGFIIKGITSVVKAVVGVVSKVVGGVFGFLIKPGGSGKKAAPVNTLTKSLDPEAFRKIAFGRIAAPLDQRYWEVWGTSGTKFDEVIAACTHTINAFKELYFEDELAINAAGVVQGKYVGALTRTTRTGAPGQASIALGGGQYDAAATFDGCAHMALHWVPDEKKLPNGIPSRYTQVIEAAMLYDPRRDSTVPGGSGTHRINNQTTWAYATLDGNGQPIGRNNALQALWYLIGWRIAKKDAAGVLTGELELVAGRGIDPEDINLATFIAAANACEAAGYYTDLVLSTGDTHTANEDKITCGGLIGQLIDPGGLWCYYANVNDTANVAVTLTDADVIEGTPVSWNASKGMNEQFTGVVGKFVNPAASVLFQAFPYPMVRDAVYEANLGKKVRKTQDFEQVLDNTLAQRLARLKLNEAQYQGEFAGGFNYRALLAQAWSVVRYISERHEFDLLFRVYRQDISTENGVGMLLRQIDASIWTAGTVNAALASGAGVKYNASQEIAATGVAVTLVPMAGAGGTLADGFKIAWAAPPANVRRTEIRYRLQGTLPWLTDGPVAVDVLELVVGPLFSGAIYEAAVRHISIHEVPGPWIAPAAFMLGTTGNVNYAAIAAAGGTAVWGNITGTGKPENNADVTLTHVASSVVNQALIATDPLAKPKLDGMIAGAGPPINLTQIAGTTTTQAGNTIRSTGGGDASGMVGTPLRGAQLIAMDILPGAHFTLLGFDDTAAGNNSNQLAWAAYRPDTGQAQLWSNGVGIFNITITTNLTGQLVIVYDNNRIFFQIGTTRYGTPLVVGPDLLLYPKFWAYSANQTYTGIRHQAAAAQPDINLNILDGGASYVVRTRAELLTLLGVASSVVNQALIATDATAKTRLDAGLDGDGIIRLPIPQIIGVTQDTGVVRPIPKGASVIRLMDGASYSFPIGWGNGLLPTITAMAGGYISATEYIDAKALNISAAGFTAYAKRVTAATPTLVTLSTASTPSAPRQHEKAKATAAEAYDDAYTFQYDVLITNILIAPGEYEAGWIIVGIWTNDGTGWVLNSTRTHNGGFGTSTTTRLNQQVVITRDGMGNGDLFGLSIEDQSGSCNITSFDQVSWSTSTGQTINSATPTGYPGIDFLISGGIE
jgi:hypothetical protein